MKLTKIIKDIGKHPKEAVEIGAVLLSGFLGSTYAVEDSTKSPVYNYESKKYISSPGGIDENFLNNSGFDYFHDEDYILFVSTLDSIEKEDEFIKKEEIEAGLEVYIMSEVMKINFEDISYVDSISDDKIEKSAPPIEGPSKFKKLLNDLQKIYDRCSSNTERVYLMYSRIGFDIKTGRNDPSKVTIRTIIDLINGKKGDCSDVVPAYFCLLNYFNIPTYFRMGKLKEGGSLHTWLTIKTEDGFVDVDPALRSKIFVPFENRNKEIDHNQLKEEFMIYKK